MFIGFDHMIKYNLGKLSHSVTECGTSYNNLLLILGCWTSHGENKCQATTVHCPLLTHQRVPILFSLTHISQVVLSSLTVESVLHLRLLFASFRKSGGLGLVSYPIS